MRSMATHMTAGANLASVRKIMHLQQQLEQQSVRTEIPPTTHLRELRALCDELQQSIDNVAEATEVGIDALVAAASCGSAVECAAEKMRRALRDGEFCVDVIDDAALYTCLIQQ
jgi:DNA-binding transcriptional MerR regulator